jgi:hypothetical protein
MTPNFLEAFLGGARALRTSAAELWGKVFTTFSLEGSTV